MSALPNTIGGYQILSKIGQGGMGVVYQAKDPKTGALYAIKSVAAPKETLLFRMRCEIYALSQLRHPGIVRIFAQGAEQGLPWYSMEWIQGEPLLRYCEKPPKDKDELLLRLGLLSKISEALAFLHGEGFLHLDIKPDNVLLRDGSPTLVDFGLVSSQRKDFGKDKLSPGGVGYGTPDYMAPEQITGGSLDTRADLYSLGCVLYELITGVPPFVTGASHLTLRAHLKQEVSPPSTKVGWLPKELDALVLSLLAKSPKERMGYAEDVAERLTSLGVPRASHWPKPRPYLYRPQFVGREETLNALLERLSLLETEASFVFVEGESGVGKTRFASELAREAERRGVTVCVAECAPGRESEALYGLRPLLQLLSDRCRAQGPAGTDRLLGARGKLLALYEPSLAGLTDEPPPVELSPEASRLRLFFYLSESLAALCRETKLLLIVDDLQWADALSLGFLGYLVTTKALSAERLMILGLARSEERSALSSLYQKAPPIELGRLGEDDVRRMVSDMLATPPDAVLDAFIKPAQGRPFYVAEYLRAAMEEGVLVRAPGESWKIVKEPKAHQDQIKALLAQRLLDLRSAERDILAAAAVIGRELDLGVMRALFAERDAELLESLHELLRRQLLEEDAQGNLRFSHDKLREVIYEGLPEDQRRALHHKVAEALSVMRGSLEQMGALATHWRLAGEREKARRCYLTGARFESSRYSLDAAAALYQGYLSLEEHPEREGIGVTLELARKVLLLQGKLEKAQSLLEEALKNARALHDPALEAASLEGLAEVFRAKSRPKEAQSLYESALRLHKERDDQVAEGRVCCALLPILIDQGQTEEAQTFYERVKSIYQATQEKALEAEANSHYANLHWTQGKLEEAQALYERVFALQKELKDRLNEGKTVANLAGLAYNLGFPERAETLWRAALAIHREVGNKRNEGILLGNLVGFLQEQGRAAEANQAAQEALLIHRKVGNVRSEALLEERMATWQQNNGGLNEARSSYLKALSLLEGSSDKVYKPYVMLSLARLERRAGAWKRAEELLDEAERLFVEIEDALGLLEVTCQRGHLALAQKQDAAPFLKAAQEQTSPKMQTEKSYANNTIKALQAAIKEASLGRTLLQGEAPLLLPKALRKLLSST